MRLFVFRPGIHLLAETAGFRRYTADMAGIFSSTKQGGYLYGIYRLIRYGIDFLAWEGCNDLFVC